RASTQRHRRAGRRCGTCRADAPGARESRRVSDSGPLRAQPFTGSTKRSAMAQQPLLPAASVGSGRQPSRATSQEGGAEASFVLNWSSLAVAALLAAGAITAYMLVLPRWLGVEQMDIGITVGRLADPSGGVADVLTRVAWHVG